MKKIILFILLFTPLFAFGETELKPTPSKEIKETENVIQSNWFKRNLPGTEYLVGLGTMIIGIGTIATAIITPIISAKIARKQHEITIKQLEQAKLESKRQYEIAKKSMLTPLLQEWMNEIYELIFDLNICIDRIDDFTEINDKNRSEHSELLDIIYQKLIKLNLKLDIKEHSELYQVTDGLITLCHSQNIISKQKERHEKINNIIISYKKIIQEQWDRIAKYDNESSS